MPSNRHNLILDEQAFQGLLCAAFIVQEYNDRQNRDRVAPDEWTTEARQPEPEARPAAELSLCRHCGASTFAEGSRCESCGRDQFRPGERLQRNWASMWLMSQGEDFWAERSGETREVAPEVALKAAPEAARKDLPLPSVAPRALPNATRESVSSVLTAPSKAREIAARHDTVDDLAVRESAGDKSAVVRSAVDTATLDAAMFNAPTVKEPTLDAAATLDRPTLEPAAFHAAVSDDQAHVDLASGAHIPNQAKAESKSARSAIDETMDATNGHLTLERFAPEDSALAVPAFQISASVESSPVEASAHERHEPISDASDASRADEPGHSSWLQHLADLRATLGLHRSNLYLMGAVLVAALALLWPTASSPRRAALGPWERALITLGLAEAPEPAIHLQGDPAIEVWVDPHTALYYCPGEEQYGKTADGRLSSQREAQMERFEPAGRSACE